MRHALLWIGFWFLTLLGAWWIGSGGLDDTSGASVGDSESDVALLQAEVDRLRTELESRGPVLRTSEAGGRPDNGGTSGGAGTGSTRSAAADEALPAFTLDGAKNADEVMQRFFAYVRSMLARGEEGHLELLRTFNDVLFGSKENQKKLEALFGNDREAVRYIYPLIRFMVENEGAVVAMTETAYKTMANDPKHFEEFDDNTLEFITEGVSVVLPGAVSEDRMKTFREYAKKILDTPEEEQSEAVRRNRNEIERVLRIWAPPITPKEALAKLQEGEVEPRDVSRLLAKLTPEMIEQVDVVRYLGPAIASNDYRAIGALSRVKLTARQVDQLDQSLLQGAEKGRVNGWTVRYYLDNTGRGTWHDARPLVEQGLAAGGKTAEVFGDSVMRMTNKPDADWVRWMIEHYTLSESLKRRLQLKFGLDK